MTTTPVPTCTDDLLGEIEAAMANATPGYWYQTKGIGLVVDHNECGVVCETCEDNPVDAIYIAACNPSNIRQLIDRLRAAEVDAGRYQGMRAIVMKSTGMAEEEYNSRADSVIALDAEREAKQ